MQRDSRVGETEFKWGEFANWWAQIDLGGEKFLTPAFSRPVE